MAVKRFRSPVDGDERRLYGDEPRREWRALELLARYAPGLAPRPVRADLAADRRQCSERLSERQAARNSSQAARGTWPAPATPSC